GDLQQGIELAPEPRISDVARYLTRPGGSAARGTAAVRDEDGKALVGEPLVGEVGVAAVQHLLVVGAGIGGDEHRELSRSPLVPGGEKNGGAQPSAADGPDGDRWRERRCLRMRWDVRPFLAIQENAHARTEPLQAGAG